MTRDFRRYYSSSSWGHENLPLPSELQAFVEEEVRNGHYRSADEMIWEALFLLRERRRGIVEEGLEALQVLKEENYGPVRALLQGRQLLGLPPYMTVRCYAVDGLLIDSGLPCFTRGVLDWARGQKVGQAVITHHHEDHSGNAAGLQAARIPVRGSADTSRRLERGFGVRLYQSLVWGGPAPRTALDQLGPSVETAHHRFQVLSAPGHCDDQVVFYEPNQGWLFSGDAFLHRRVKYFRGDEDFAQTVRSLERLCALEFETLFCAHRPVLEGGRQALRDKLQYMQDLEGQVRELHARGLPPGQIRRRLLGREPWLLYLFSAGDLCKSNLVRSILSGPRPRRQ